MSGAGRARAGGGLANLLCGVMVVMSLMVSLSASIDAVAACARRLRIHRTRTLDCSSLVVEAASWVLPEGESSRGAWTARLLRETRDSGCQSAEVDLFMDQEGYRTEFGLTVWNITGRR